MRKKENNYAFIDSQNVYRGIKNLGWVLDWKRFRIYLNEKYNVSTAYLFIGYIPEQGQLYETLQKAGFILKFKPVVITTKGELKGNVDADMVLQAMIDFDDYEQAIIVSSDGDFYSLVQYLAQEDKLKTVLSPYIYTCSTLLKKTAQKKITFLNDLKEKLAKKKRTP